MQDVRGPRRALQPYLAKVRPSWAEKLTALDALASTPISDEARTATRSAIDDIARGLKTEERQLVAAAGRRAHTRALRLVELLVMGHAVQTATSGAERFEARDRGMAENALALVKDLGPDELAVIWAHNGHIAHDATGLLATNLGTRLEAALGDRYVSTALHTRKGTYTVSADRTRPFEPAEVTLDASASGFYAEGLGAIGLDALLLDVGSIDSGPAETWLRGPRLHHSLGWLASEWELKGSPVRLKGRFDFVLFIDETTGAKRLPRQP